MDQVAGAIADALERGPGYDVLVDILGSWADGQRRNGPSVRRYHYAQTAPTGVCALLRAFAMLFLIWCV